MRSVIVPVSLPRTTVVVVPPTLTPIRSISGVFASRREGPSASSRKGTRMIAYTEYLTMKTAKRYEILDITDEVAAFLREIEITRRHHLGHRDAYHGQHFRQRS